VALFPRLNLPWDLSPEQARALQAAWRDRVLSLPLPAPPRLLAGLDVSYPQPDVARAAAVVLTYPDLELIEVATAQRGVTFPYRPGLLAFREGPVLLEVLARLHTRPDVLFFDGHGIAHPRGLGLAAHLGLMLDWPSLGCAKAPLIPPAVPPDRERGHYAPISLQARLIGAAVRTQTDVRPVYVSIGHRIDLETAVQLVLTSAPRYRLPEPLRLAHHYATQAVTAQAGA